jgi:Family of unknown function (DUF6489)
MKITIDVDCTPEEARTFFGLPHIAPMQEAVVAKMQERLVETIAAMDPEAMMKLWFPGGLHGIGQMQERFWDQFLSGLSAAAGSRAKPKSTES